MPRKSFARTKRGLFRHKSNRARQVYFVSIKKIISSFSKPNSKTGGMGSLILESERIAFKEYDFTKCDESIFKGLVGKCEFELVKITRHSKMIKSKVLGNSERVYRLAESRKGRV